MEPNGKKFCRECGHRLTPDANYCGGCGTHASRASDSGSRLQDRKLLRWIKDSQEGMRRAFSKAPKLWISCGIVLLLLIAGISLSHTGEQQPAHPNAADVGVAKPVDDKFARMREANFSYWKVLKSLEATAASADADIEVLSKCFDVFNEKEWDKAISLYEKGAKQYDSTADKIRALPALNIDNELFVYASARATNYKQVSGELQECAEAAKRFKQKNFGIGALSTIFGWGRNIVVETYNSQNAVIGFMKASKDIYGEEENGRKIKEKGVVLDAEKEKLDTDGTLLRGKLSRRYGIEFPAK